ncbi:DNA polymerase IV [Clostridiaceae bacterium HSG29]|nr:DNA polymerase IV [Clostridiaceae bacterium HSG29]
MMRKILHVDLDAFFAAVEEMDNNELIGKPVIVGGTGDRGVVSTCNYKAREFGVHSAMAGFIAKKQCPDGIFIKPRMSRYLEVSRQVFDIIYSITDQIQQVSIDEAYIEVTDLYQNPMYIAKLIKKRVLKEVGITISVGISYNKFLAKLASDWNKPDGIKVITEDMIPDILRPLNVGKIHGIGKKSVQKLNSLGIFYVDDLLNYSKSNLKSFLGNMGVDIYDRIRGIDNRSLKEEVKNKSYGTESTLKKDTRNKEKLYEILKNMMESIFDGLDKKNRVAKTISIKIKFNDFSVITRSKTLDHYLFNLNDYQILVERIFNEIDIKKNVRLIGISVSNIDEKENEQLNIFNEMN